MRAPDSLPPGKPLPGPSIPFNFCGLESGSDFASSSTVILPVPLETGPPTVGASQGPFRVIAASRQAEVYDMELGCEVSARGIYTHGELELDHGETGGTFAVLMDCLASVLAEEKFPLILGGDRTLTLSAVEACRKRFPGLTAVLLSGRANFEDWPGGRRTSPRAVGRRVSEMTRTRILGYRSISAKGEAYRESAADLLALRDVDLLGQAIPGSVLSDAGGDIYLSIDVNVFDPAVMPIPSNPEPGGLDWVTVTGLLKALFRNATVRGCDLVGFAPAPETVVPEQLVSRLALKIIGYRFHL